MGGGGGGVGNGRIETFWEAGNALDLNLSSNSVYIYIYVCIFFKGEGALHWWLSW